MENQITESILAKYQKIQQWRKKATYNWRKKNVEKHNEIVRNYYNNHKNNTDFMDRIRTNARANYKRRKERKLQEQSVEISQN